MEDKNNQPPDDDKASFTEVFTSRKLASLLTLGFASGLPLFLTSRTLQLWMQDSKVDIGSITLFGLVALPYSLKFLWAPLIDRFRPPLLSARRGWLVLTQIGLVLAILALGLQTPSQNSQVLQVLAITTLVISFLSATQDIAGDAYRTDVLAERELEIGTSLWILGYRIALFVTYFVALALADRIAWSNVYLIMAGLMSLGILTTLWAPEPIHRGASSGKPPTIKELGIVLFGLSLVGTLFWGLLAGKIKMEVLYISLAVILLAWIGLAVFSKNNTRRQLSPAIEADIAAVEDENGSLQAAIIRPLQEFFERFGNQQAILILLFIILYKLGDSLVGVTGNLFLRELGYSKTDLAGLQGVVGLISTSIGVLFGGVVMTKIGVNRSLWFFGLLQLVSNLGYYSLNFLVKNYQPTVQWTDPEEFSRWIGAVWPAAGAIGIENFSAGLVTVATVAYLSRLCNRDFTATQFALFSSFMAISRDLLSAPSGELVKATGWPTFFLLSLVFALPGLLLLPLVAPWQRSTAQI